MSYFYKLNKSSVCDTVTCLSKAKIDWEIFKLKKGCNSKCLQNYAPCLKTGLVMVIMYSKIYVENCLSNGKNIFLETDKPKMMKHSVS